MIPDLKRVQAICRHWFGQPVAVTALYGDVDLNYRVRLEGGECYVLKIRPRAGQVDHEFVEFQGQLLTHLDGKAGSFLTPKIQPTLDHKAWLEIPGENQMAWMVSYLDGPLLDGQKLYSESLLISIGRAVACVDQKLIDFGAAFALRRIQWDIAHLLDLQEDIRFVAEPKQRALLSRCFGFFETQVLPELRQQPRSIIHNDGGNQHNMILANDDQVLGIIDFGDAVHTQRICGLGIAAAYASFGTTDPLLAIRLVTRGYEQVMPLSPQARGLICGLVIARLAMSVTISSRRLAGDASNAYHFSSAAPAWQVLQDLEQRGFESCRDQLLEPAPKAQESSP